MKKWRKKLATYNGEQSWAAEEVTKYKRDESGVASGENIRRISAA